MTTRRARDIVTQVLLLVLLPGAAWSQAQPPPQPQAQPQAQTPGVEVLTHGPVHEAFAEPTTTQPEQGPVIAKQPPEPIEELPPDQKPEGDNVQWIPGYWAWDDESNDYVWVSGCWRDVPPGRRWVPGHWQQVEGGWVWVSGFWATEDTNQVQYLPPPPPTLDQGPTAPAPGQDSIYVPGIWVYETNRYMWRPGFWYTYQPDWVWCPAHYVWTPAGCLFVDGYWDHPLDDRGLLFAPALVNREVFLAARRPFVPFDVVNPDFLLGSLFVRPSYGHYYFGDYFEPQFARRGYIPWPDYNPVKGAHDHNYAYYRRLHAANPRWETGLRRLYSERASGAIPRPPRTLAEQHKLLQAHAADRTDNVAVSKNVNITHAQNLTAVTPLRQLHNSHVTRLGGVGGGKESVPARTMRLEELQKEERERERQAAAAIREGSQRRREGETRIFGDGKSPVQHTDPAQVMKWETPKAPAAVHRPGAAQRTPRAVPPAVTHPKHEERPIPKYTAPHPPRPPKKGKD